VRAWVAAPGRCPADLPNGAICCMMRRAGGPVRH